MECKSYEQLPFQKLFQIAEQKYESMDYEDAQYFYDLAYEKNPNHQMLLLCYCHCLKNNQKAEKAQKILEKSLKDLPNGSYKRYFELGEIYQGIDSIQCFERGIEEAKKGLKNPFLSVVPEQQIKRDIAQAYASIAQVCMTDLLQQKQAEAKCIESLQKGRKMDQTCMDVHLQAGNYLLFKQKFQQAKAELLLVCNNILAQKEQYQSQLILSTGKYLIQVQEYAKSIQLFQKLHQDQSNEAQIVYLLAYCAFNLGKYDQSEEYLEEYEQSKENNELMDQEIEDAVRQLREELSKKKKDIQQTGGDEEEWMDVQQDNFEQDIQ